MKRSVLFGVSEVLNPGRDNLGSHLRWGSGHTHSLLLLGAVGLAALGPLAYVFYRDWRLQRAFRRYWGKSRTKSTAPDPVARKPLIVQDQLSPKGLRPATGAHARPTSVFSRPAWALRCTPPQPITPVAPASGNEAGAVNPTATPTGVLEIEGRLGEGEIYVDGAFFGNTPGSLVLVQGWHEVELRKLGLTTRRREVFVIAGETVKLRGAV